MNNIDLMNEDCLQGLKKLDTDSVDLIVTSPPYFNARDYANYETYEDYLEFIKEVFTECLRVLKKGRMLCLNLSCVIQARQSRQHESVRFPIPYDVCSILTREVGYKFIDDIIWEKPESSAKNRNGNFFRNRKPLAYKPNIVTEQILVLQKPSDKLIDNILAKNKQRVSESLVLGEYERTNVWKIRPVKNKKHPAVFPIELPEKLISYYSFKHDLILDPFSGLGTTGQACKNLERFYLGFEQHENYFNLSTSLLL